MSYFEDQNDLAMELGMGPFDGTPEMDQAIYDRAAADLDGDDDSDMWRAHKEESQKRREFNRNSSAQILRDKGIAFDEKNLGAHLIVKHDGKVADFWPGTGKYQVRGTGKYKRGVFNLLKDLGVK